MKGPSTSLGESWSLQLSLLFPLALTQKLALSEPVVE